MTEETTAAGSPAAANNAMGQVIQIDQDLVQKHLSEVVRTTVEETLNAMLLYAIQHGYIRVTAQKVFRPGFQRRLQRSIGGASL